MNQVCISATSGADALLSSSQTGFRIASAQFRFDPIKFANPLHAFLGNRRGPGTGDLDQLAPCMRPAGKPNGRTDTVERDQPIISSITVDLQNA